MYDVFFISYNELNADKHWMRLKNLIPWAQRIENIKGIREAHTACSMCSTTNYFYTIDADNFIYEDELLETISNFDVDPTNQNNFPLLHVFHSYNPILNFSYGWGGIKLWPKEFFKNPNYIKNKYIDFSTTFPLNVHEKVLSETRFNTSSWDTWRSAFREAYKLKLRIKNNIDASDFRIINYHGLWYSPPNEQAEFYLECKEGARFATKLVDSGILIDINNYDILKSLYDKNFKKP